MAASSSRNSTPIHLITHSRDFRLAMQRSEGRRAAVMLGVVGAILALAIFRHVTGGTIMQGATFVCSIAIILGAAAFEGALIVSARRANAQGRLISNSIWIIATIAEALLPTMAILVILLTSTLPPTEALTPPAMLVYGIVIGLSVLRLQPGLCMLAGAVSALGHAALVLLAWKKSVEIGHAFSWPVMFSYPAMLVFSGAAAAFAAREIRGYVASSLHEAHERQRVQLVARNTLIFGLAKLAEYRDTDTGAHLERISAYSGLIAEALRSDHAFINDAWIQSLCVASSMHDIGKVGVPDAVLCKPGKLTDDERKVIQTHPRLGFDALQAILERHGADALLEMSAQIAACHHERWDGKGYPAGLVGEAIPLPARIISVADVYDALTSARVYKPAMSHAEAGKLIEEGRGTQFDPNVVEAFRRISQRFDAVRKQFADATASAPAHAMAG